VDAALDGSGFDRASWSAAGWTNRLLAAKPATGGISDKLSSRLDGGQRYGWRVTPCSGSPGPARELLLEKQVVAGSIPREEDGRA